MRRFCWSIVPVLLAGITLTAVWANASHRLSYVVTNGASMRPLYRAGDLVVVAKKNSYRVGDIVAYRNGHSTVLHRIIGGDASGFSIKGDSNQSVDPLEPAGRQLIGRAILHIPAGGRWLRRVLSPPVGIAAVVLLAGTGGAARRRRRGRRQRMPTGTTTPSSSAARTVRALLPSPRARAAAGAIAAAGMLGAGLAVLAWTRPTVVAVPVHAAPTRSMTFSYVTTVARTPAYDGTVVRAPEPVFRTVAKTVDVIFTYTGPPGRVMVDARLALANGWHSTVPLAAARAFTGDTYRGTVRLDLDSLQARASAGGRFTGMPATEVGIVIVPHITTATGGPFAPALKLTLTPLALTVADGPLVVPYAAPPLAITYRPQTVARLGSISLRVSTARIASGGAVLAAVLAAAALLVLLRRSPPVPQSTLIRQRYRRLLVPVREVAAVPGRLVVQVAAFPTLVRLAERYGLLILDAPAPASTTAPTPAAAVFAVHDDAATYWYGTDGAAWPAAAGSARPAVPAAAAPPAAPQTAPQTAPQADPEAGPEVADPEPAGRTEARSHWQLASSAATDDLTKLADRSLFEEEVQFAISNGGGTPWCLMLIELDDLDRVNAEYGRDAGDAVLVAIAERLRQTVRPKDLVARLGGGRFAILFEDVAAAVMDKIAQRVIRTVNESVPVREDLVRIQASLGVAHAPASAGGAGPLMAQAAAALAAARTAGTQRYAWFARRPEPGSDQPAG